MSGKKTIEDLRALLFETLQGVKDGTLSIDRAQCISDLSQVMVNSAKVEVEFIKPTNGDNSTFLTSDAKALPPGITGSTVHRLK